MSGPDSCRFEHIPVSQIMLDIQNPRIAKWLEMYGDNISADQIALALGAGTSHTGESGPTFFTLKQSIRTNGGVIHPIIVNRTSDDELVAIEGNTRVQIYREFKE